jgi:ATP-binding cassette subfamily B (MDR/TAP) protein 1
VGSSGSGKSTVISLLERFYDPINGDVSMEHVSLTKWNVSYLRRQQALVGQEPKLFSGTIADNIQYGLLHEECSLEQTIEAAKAANIHNFITQLPEGYDTDIGEKVFFHPKH